MSLSNQILPVEDTSLGVNLEIILVEKTWRKSRMSANSNCSLYDRRRRRLEETENIRRFIAWLKERQFLEAELAKQKAEDERVASLHYEH